MSTYPLRRRRALRTGVISTAFLATAVVAALAFPVINFVHVVEHPRLTVEHRERVQRDGESVYMIYTDAGVMTNTDSFFDFKFNSADIYAEMRPDRICDVITRGYRVPFFSRFPNIVEARCE